MHLLMTLPMAIGISVMQSGLQTSTRKVYGTRLVEKLGFKNWAKACEMLWPYAEIKHDVPWFAATTLLTPDARVRTRPYTNVAYPSLPSE